MTNKEVAFQIDKHLEKVKDALMQKFGDEGHDIGDAGNYAELLGNTMEDWNDTHESYQVDEFLQVISDTLGVDVKPLYLEMCSWTREQWSEAGAWVGFTS